MAYQRSLNRLVFLFDVNGTTEIAQTQLQFSQTEGASLNVPTSTEMAAAETNLLTLYGISALLRMNAYRFIGSKYEFVDADGHYLADAIVHERTPSVGDEGDFPVQNTMVLTLQSGSTLGKGNWGRMYLPGVIGVLASGTPYISEANALAIATAGAAFIDSMNDWYQGVTNETTGVARIMSQVGTVPTSKPITTVGAGRVNDTQRRRRNRLEEGIQYVAV